MVPMIKKTIAAGVCACALVLSLGACGGTSSSSSSTSASSKAATTASSTSSSTKSSSFDANKFYVGTWRASVDTTGNTVYGNVAGKEAMVDVIVNSDGSCEVKPLKGHEDLLTEKGTWTGTEKTLTLTLPTAGKVELTVKDGTTLTGPCAPFKISGFDTMEFVLY